MLDMLKMRSKEKIDLEGLKELHKDLYFERKNDTIYRICQVISQQGKHFATIKTDPIWSSVHETQIQINPSKWESLTSFTDSLSKLCDPGSLEIVRIDHAVDVSLPIEHLHAGLRVKFKQYSAKYNIRDEAYGGKLTGFYLGKEPELYCCYDKGIERNLRGELNRPLAYQGGEFSRIELRQVGRKIKHRWLPELINYLDDPPFKQVEFYLPQEGYEKKNELLDLLKTEGFNRQYFKLNSHGHFKRNTIKYLKPTDFQAEINQLYRHKLSHFLGGSNEST